MTNQELQTLFEQVSQLFGQEVGDKIKTEIQNVIDAQNINLDQLNSAVQTIQGLLDADPDTPEFDVGQNIIQQLTDHLTRITGLETTVNRLTGDETVAGSIANQIKVERDRAANAESVLQGAIDTNTAAIDTLNGDETVDGSVRNLIASMGAASEDTVNAAITGAGLNADGTYTANTSMNYIDDATSLKDADEKLDAAVKAVETATGEVETRVGTVEGAVETLNGDETVAGSVAKTVKDAKDAAVADAKTYADTTFLRLEDVTGISATTLSSIFRQAMDDAYSGASTGGTSGGDSDGDSDGAVL